MNDKLVNELKRLWLAKIVRKTTCLLNLTTIQISVPFGYPMFSPNQTWFILGMLRFNSYYQALKSFNVSNTNIHCTKNEVFH